MRIREWYRWLFLICIISIIFSIIFGIIFRHNILDGLIGVCICLCPVIVLFLIGMIIDCLHYYEITTEEIILKKRNVIKKINQSQIIELSYIRPINIFLFQIGFASLCIRYIPDDSNEPVSIRYSNANLLCISMTKKKAIAISRILKKRIYIN